MGSLLGIASMIAGGLWWAVTAFKDKPHPMPPLPPAPDTNRWRIEASMMLDQLIGMYSAQGLDASSLRAAGRQLFAEPDEEQSR